MPDDSPTPLEDFIEQFLADQEASKLRSMEEYLARFPGDSEGIAREYLALKEEYGRARSPDGRSIGRPAHVDSSGDAISGLTIGPYRSIRELGRGGQGIVYLAKHTRLRRKVALKVLTGLGELSEGALIRFQREAEVASRLDHPGICTVYDSGTFEGAPYIALRYVDGETLSRKIRTAREASDTSTTCIDFEGTEPEREPAITETSSTPSTQREVLRVVEVIEKVACALHVAHEAGVIHRDIKPGNIMVTQDGDPVILDFGLARDLESDLATMTRSGDLLGTPAYMSPEQLTRHSIRLDARTDIYSLGAVLYECLALRRPFEAPTREGLYQAILSKDPPDPSQLNPAVTKDLKAILETALEKDRDRRYQGMLAFAEDLRAVREGRSVSVKPLSSLSRAWRWSRREPAKAALILVTALALPVIAVLVTNHVGNLQAIEAARLARIDLLKDEEVAQGFWKISESGMDWGLKVPHEGAIEHFERASALEGGSREAALGLVWICLLTGEPEAALAALKSENRLVAAGYAECLLKAQALRELGRAPEAERIEISDPEEAIDYFFLGEILLRDGAEGADSLRKAQAAFRMAILLSPSPRLPFHMRRGQAAIEADDAPVAHESAVALRRHWPKSAASQTQAGFALHRGVGTEASLDEAIAAYRAALQIDPNAWLALEGIALALADKGHLEEAKEALAKSFRTRRKLVSSLPTANDALHAAVMFRRWLMSERERIHDRRELCEVHPGWWRLLEDHHRAARNAAEKLTALQWPGGHAVLSRAHIGRGELDEAIRELQQAIRDKTEMKPGAEGRVHIDTLLSFLQIIQKLANHGLVFDLRIMLASPADLHAELAEVLRGKGLVEQAIETFREAIRMKHDESLGREESEQRQSDSESRWNKALEELIAESRTGKSVRRKGRLASESYLGLSKALGELGRYREAIAAIGQAHDIEPDNPLYIWVRRLLAPLAARQMLLEIRIDKLLVRDADPATASEGLELAGVALNQGKFAMATRWYRQAFEGELGMTRDPFRRYRERAAMAALRASTSGSGTDKEQIQWRARALEWLRSDLETLGSRLQHGRINRWKVRWALERWQQCQAFEAVQGEALATLSDDERSAWQSLWTEVQSVIDEIP